MFNLTIDQHSKQLTVNLRDEQGDVVLRRQVGTKPQSVRVFFQSLASIRGYRGRAAGRWVSCCHGDTCARVWPNWLTGPAREPGPARLGLPRIALSLPGIPRRCICRGHFPVPGRRCEIPRKSHFGPDISKWPRYNGTEVAGRKTKPPGFFVCVTGHVG